MKCPVNVTLAIDSNFIVMLVKKIEIYLQWNLRVQKYKFLIFGNFLQASWSSRTIQCILKKNIARSLSHHPFCASAEYSSQNDQLVECSQTPNSPSVACPPRNIFLLTLLPTLNLSFRLRQGVASSRKAMLIPRSGLDVHLKGSYDILCILLMNLTNYVTVCLPLCCTVRPQLHRMILQVRDRFQHQQHLVGTKLNKHLINE